MTTRRVARRVHKAVLYKPPRTTTVTVKVISGDQHQVARSIPLAQGRHPPRGRGSRWPGGQSSLSVPRPTCSGMESERRSTAARSSVGQFHALDARLSPLYDTCFGQKWGVLYNIQLFRADHYSLGVHAYLPSIHRSLPPQPERERFPARRLLLRRRSLH